MLKTKIDFSNIQVLEAGLDSSNQDHDLLDLTDKQAARIRRTLKEEISAWESETAPLIQKLEHWYDLSEGIIDDSDEPYPGAFHTHIDLIGIYLKIYTSIEKRSILGPETLWYAETEADPEFDSVQDALPEIDEMMNYKARAEWNVTEAIGEAFPCVNRDGLAVLKIPHVVDTEEVEDRVLLRNLEDLILEFPPGESSLSKKEWGVLAQLVEANGSDETPIEVPVTSERTNYYGPKAYVIERINFVTFPSNARSLDREFCRGHGDRFYLRREEVRQKMESEEWYEDACKEFLKKTKKAAGSDPTSYRTNQESITGINRGDKADEFEFYELTYWMRLEQKGVEKKYVFIYTKEHNILMFAKVYWYRTPSYYAKLRIERRANQIDGKSVVGQLEFLNEELDLLHNMCVQGWQISNIPSFKMEKGLAKELDLEADENLWHPGVVFHLPAGTFEKFIQFDVRPTDNGAITRGEAQLLNYAALIMGIDAFLASGRPSPEDPNAPGNKTQLLVNQGNIRMEDPLSELRYGVEEVGQICLSHLYQFGPAQIQYKGTEGKKKITKYLSKKFLRSGIRLKMQGLSVVMNSENEFRKGIEKWGIAIKEPLVAQKAKYRLEAMHQAFRKGRVPDYARYIPTMEEAEAYDVQVAKQAILNMAMEQQAAQEEARMEQMKAQEQQKAMALKGLSDKVRAQNLIKQITEQNLAAQLQEAA